MKFHRIEGKLPANVSVRINEHLSVLPLTRSLRLPVSELFDLADYITSSSRTAHYSSNMPISFTLDVPEDAATETAKALRAMADELEGGTRT